jgi:glycosyltransferase involved in cell wall biosynthesis
MDKKLRLFYAAGPGDIIGSYRHWRQREDDPSQVAVTYSSQFWDVCRRFDAESLAVSRHQRMESLTDGCFRIEHRPKSFGGHGGIVYHLAEVWYGILLLASILRFRPDFAIIAEGTTHWFILGVLPVLGVRVIPAVHGVLWPKYKVCRVPQRVLNAVNKALFFRSRTYAVLSVSSEVTAQLNELGCQKRIIQFFPIFKRESFSGIADPPAPDPFRVFFAGRVEREKGVFTILKIACDYRTRGEFGIVFDIVGGGSALAELREMSERAGLGATFRCYGHVDRGVLLEVLGRSHVIVVPTTTDYTEGLNKVVLEGVLAGRPVITSAVCPALDLVREAVVEVAPEDEAGYSAAILALRGDPELYARKRRACLDYQDRFYDEANGWAAALSRALTSNFITRFSGS